MAATTGIIQRGITINFKGDLSGLKTSVVQVKSLLSGMSAEVKSVSSNMNSGFKSATSGVKDLADNTKTAKNDVKDLAAKGSEAGRSISSSMRGASNSLLDFASKATIAAHGLAALVRGAFSLGAALLKPAMSAEQVNIAFTGLFENNKEKAQAFLKQLKAFDEANTFFDWPTLTQSSRSLLAMGVEAKKIIPYMERIGDTVATMGGGSEDVEKLVRAIGQIQTKGKLAGDEILQLTEAGIPVRDILGKAFGKTREEIEAMIEEGIDAEVAIDALMKGMERFAGGMARNAESTAGMIDRIKTNLNKAAEAFGKPIIEAKGLKDALRGIGDIVSGPAFQGFASGTGQAIANAINAISENTKKAAKSVKDLIPQLALISIKGVDFGDLVKGYDDFKASISDTSKLETLSNSFKFLRRNADSAFDVMLKKGRLALAQLTGAPVAGKGERVDRSEGSRGQKASPIDEFRDKIEKLGGPLGLLNIATIKAGQAIFDFGVFLRGIDVNKVVTDIKTFGTALQNEFGPPLEKISNIVKSQFNRVMLDLGELSRNVGNWFKTDLNPAIAEAAPKFADLGKTLLTDVAPGFLQLREPIIGVLESGFKVFGPILGQIIPPLVNLAGIIAGGLSDAIKFFTPYVVDAATAVGNFAKDLIERVGPIIQNFIDNIKPHLENARNVWNAIWPGMSTFLQGVWDIIVGIVKIGWAILTGIFKITLDLISGNWGQAWEDMKTMLGGIWDGIKTVVSGGINQVKGVIQMVWGLLSGPLSKPFDDALARIRGFFFWVENKIREFSGQPINVDMSMVNQRHALAGGAENFAGGMALVGEKGPELVHIPKGSDVFTAHETKSMLKSFNQAPMQGNFKYASASSASYPMSGGSDTVINVYVQSPDVWLDSDRIAEKSAPKLVKQYRVKGGRK